MKHYCTYFDSHYLTRGLALHQSLATHAGDFVLVVLCMDEGTTTALRGKVLPHVRLLPVTELTAKYPDLAAARADRTKLEFYFTCTSWLMQHLLPQIPAGELLTYLDADLYFFGSPQTVYDEIGAASVAITPHRFPSALAHLERYGRFNVGWVSFRHDNTGLACAADWAAKCAAWCFNRLEPDRFADQKYLDAWENKFPGTVSLSHPGVNVAPWNIRDCPISAGASGPRINGQPLIFYHFHALLHLGRQLYDPSLHQYDALLTSELRELVYRPYLRQLLGGEKIPATDVPDLLPPAKPADPRSGLAVQHLLERLQASELDRAQRLLAIDMITDDRDLARADLERTITFYQAELAQRDAHLQEMQKDGADRLAALEEYGVTTKRMEAHILAIEKDREERLASINNYQEKLKQAYADHAHNVAYIEKLHAEIVAHVKISAEHNAIIVQLNEQLRVATERRPAGP